MLVAHRRLVGPRYESGMCRGGDQGHSRRVDREELDDASDEVVQDPLDREVGDQRARELTEHVGETVLDYHLGLHEQVVGPRGPGGRVRRLSIPEIGSALRRQGHDHTAGADARLVNRLCPGGGPVTWRVGPVADYS